MMEAERAEKPPSSYGSMKSDEESVVEYNEDDELSLPAITSKAITGVRLNCVDYPETIFTQTTQQTKGPGATVFDTRYCDELEELEELDEPEEEMEDYPVADSPEPPPPVEGEGGDQIEEEGESSQPGRLHPEQCMPFIFKAIMTVLAELTPRQFWEFKSHTCSGNPNELPDVLDVVDYIIQVKGHEDAVCKALETLQYMKLTNVAEELQIKCIKSHARTLLKRELNYRYRIIHEGVPQAGKQEQLNNIYVEAQLSTQGQGAIDPRHEYRPYPGVPPPPLPAPDTFISAANLFRQKSRTGQPVRLVTTTGLPGSGKTVLQEKFMLEWSEEKINMDFQFVIPLSFSLLWRLREKEEMSLVHSMTYDLRLCKTLDCLMEPDLKFIIVMDAFDVWWETIDWNERRQITDVNEKAPLDIIVVNLLRGTLLPHARLWILGRKAHLVQIPPKLVDLETEIQGFTPEDTERFLLKKFWRSEEIRDLAMPHYIRCAGLVTFCRLPFVSWMVYTLMDSRFRYLHYGKVVPKLSEFVINFVIYQINQHLQYYHGQMSNQIEWREGDRALMKKLGKLALKMHEKNAWLFSEEEIKDVGLDVKLVTTYCGLCTLVGPELRQGHKKYAFVHLIVQEYMAALWIFLNFWLEGRNLLAHSLVPQPKLFGSKDQGKSVVPLIESAVKECLANPPGRFDMLLRHICAISYVKHGSLLTGRFTTNGSPTVKGQEEAAKVLEQKSLSHPERATLFRLCIAEMTEKEY